MAYGTVALLEAWGTFGEFTVGVGNGSLAARFILTKMKPGTAGLWENELASQMVPWREVFNPEQLSFEELLQRDLDDSRVAHELIPYLLGQTDLRAPFFPPILAIIVPKKTSGTGVEPYYPERVVATQEPLVEAFGTLFRVEQQTARDEELGKDVPTPLAVLKYNRQKSAFVIVDGQHRAMAVLALHRQLTQAWHGSASATYYSHIQVTPEQVKHIELPVCVVYFPTLADGVQHEHLNLTSICRELFVTVNRSAKRVSWSRELLLDDADIAARLMRATLSRLKNRSEDDAGVARIYSFAFGDSDLDTAKQVVAGQLEYSSAVALHKLHSALAFGKLDAFALGPDAQVDISNGLNTRNPARPVVVLRGVLDPHYVGISKQYGTTLPPPVLDSVVAGLGAVNDEVILRLFDGFRPFRLHNTEMRALRLRLSTAQAKANPIQREAYSLLFEGSGARNVFWSHVERLNEKIEVLKETGDPVPDYLTQQVAHCASVETALDSYGLELRRRRACAFFNVDYDAYSSAAVDADSWRAIEEPARAVFATVATQAFQLGFVMAVAATVEVVLPEEAGHSQRLAFTKAIVDAWLAGLNQYFAPGDDVQHTKAIGYVGEPRARVFDTVGPGLRGLLAMSQAEINERRWDFFMYAVLELVHTAVAWPAARAALSSSPEVRSAYDAKLDGIVGHIARFRARLIEHAVEADKRSKEYVLLRMTAEAQLKAEGKVADALAAELGVMDAERAANVEAKARKHLEASLGKLEDAAALLERVRATA